MKKVNHKPVTCPVCTECYFDLDFDPRGIRCAHGGPYVGYFDLVTKKIKDREGNSI